MNLLARLLWLWLVSRRRPRCPVLGPCRTPFRVNPGDLDVLGHVNNGRYLSILDLARVDLITRSGLRPKLAARGFYPVVVSEAVQFRRSLRLGERFEVETSLLGWDETTFFCLQRFVRAGGEQTASALVRARFLRRGGPEKVAPAEVVALAGLPASSPPLPAWVGAFCAVHETLRQVGAPAPGPGGGGGSDLVGGPTRAGVT